MKKIRKKTYFCLLILMILNVAGMNAQVTIGADTDPHSGALLDLISSSKGLLLPRVTLDENKTLFVLDGADEQSQMAGMLVYNAANDCLEYWNGIKWVSLCLGTANISLTSDCGTPYNPAAVMSENTGETCTFSPVDNPTCIVPSGQAYQVYLTAGAAYATLTVDPLTSAFLLTFTENNSSNARVAVVRVVNNCSGEFKDFLFTQAGATCPVGANAFTVSTTSSTLCEDGAIIAYVNNPQAGIKYVWEYGGVVVNTGNYMEITRAGKYTVHAGLLGCQTPVPQIINISKRNEYAAGVPMANYSNSGVLCSGGNVALTASNLASDMQSVQWFHNGMMVTPTANPYNTNGTASAGEWFATQKTANGCESCKSNILVLTDQTANSTALDIPVATVNGTALSGSPVICKGGTLELKIINSYPAGTTFDWFDGANLIASTNDPVYYTVAPNKTNMTISVQVSNHSGGCPSTAISPAIPVTFTAPASTTINNGKSSAAVCGTSSAVLHADNASGTEYEWFLNGTKIANANTDTYYATVAGNYTVRYQDASGCWSPVSTYITVKQDALINLAWQITPEANVVIGDTKTYTVLASPEADTYIWTANPSNLTTISPIGNGKTASVTYHAAGAVTITVTAANDCGTSSINTTVTAAPGCSPITSVMLTPDGTVNKYLDENGNPKQGSASTNFTVTASGGSPATSYEWFVDGVKQAGKTSANFTYNTPVVNAGTYQITARAYNACTGTPGNNDGAISAATTVKVTKDAPLDSSGKYRISGKTCFDVKRGNYNATCMPEASRIDDFLATKNFKYTFASPTSSTYSNLTFEITDNDGLVQTTSTLDNVLTVAFKSNINSIAAGTDKVSAKTLIIIAKYKDSANADKQVTLEIKVQDCSCGCSVKSTTSPTGWLTFMCYNLGVAENTKTMTIAQQMAYKPSGGTASQDETVYGAFYQWGRTTDGHEKRNSPSVDTKATVFDINGQASASSHVGKFVKGSNDWRNPSSNTLWYNNGKTGGDPCPPGWRVPTNTEWCSIINGNTNSQTGIPTSGATTASGNYWKWNSSGTQGWTVSPDGGSNITLFLPAAGYRNYDNTIQNVITYCSYWSSTPDVSPSSYYVSNSSTNLSPNTAYYRSAGMSVRCVAE